MGEISLWIVAGWSVFILSWLAAGWWLENQRPWLSVVACVLAGSLLYTLTATLSVWPWVAANPMAVVGLVAGYFLLCGVPYAIFRWWRLAAWLHRENLRYRQEWLSIKREEDASKTKDIDTLLREAAQYDPQTNQRDIDILRSRAERLASLRFCKDWPANPLTVPPELLAKWRSYEVSCVVHDRAGRSYLIIKPLPGRHKSRIIAWLLFWPASVLMFFLSDFLWELGQRLYDGVAQVLTRISDSVWGGD